VSGILLLWIGRPAPRPWEELAEEYRVRISRLAEFRELRVRPEEGRSGDRSRVVRREAARVREYLEAGDTLIVLDERGRQLASEQLAERLAARRAAGRVVLVVGSDLGVDEALRSEAAEVWALSRLTLPHLLARVLVLEQLYRGLDIAAGGRYHRP
jgi:23S rRNA (pseudouridine1915-N3)-methyltransferase